MLDSCNVPITPEEEPIELDTNTPNSPPVTFGVELLRMVPVNDPRFLVLLLFGLLTMAFYQTRKHWHQRLLISWQGLLYEGLFNLHKLIILVIELTYSFIAGFSSAWLSCGFQRIKKSWINLTSLNLTHDFHCYLCHQANAHARCRNTLTGSSEYTHVYLQINSEI